MGYRARIRMRAIAPIAEVLVEVTLGNHRQADFDRFERAIREGKANGIGALGVYLIHRDEIPRLRVAAHDHAQDDRLKGI